MTAYLIKSGYPCCNASSRFEGPKVGQVLKRKCSTCKRSFTVEIVKALVSGRYGVKVLKAVWTEFQVA